MTRAISDAGLARVQALMAGGTAQLPPAILRAGISVERAATGEVMLRMAADPGHGNPHGTMHAGVIATLLDTAMGYATETTLAPGEDFTTIEFKMNFLRAVALDDGVLAAVGKVTRRGSRLAVVEALATDSQRRECALALGTCMIIPG